MKRDMPGRKTAKELFEENIVHLKMRAWRAMVLEGRTPDSGVVTLVSADSVLWSNGQPIRGSEHPLIGWHSPGYFSRAVFGLDESLIKKIHDAAANSCKGRACAVTFTGEDHYLAWIVPGISF